MPQKALTFGFLTPLKTVNQEQFSPKEVERIEQFKRLMRVEVSLAQEQGVSTAEIIEQLAQKAAQLYHLAYALDQGWDEAVRQAVFA